MEQRSDTYRPAWALCSLFLLPLFPFPPLWTPDYLLPPLIETFSLASCRISYRTVQRWSTGSLPSELEDSREPDLFPLGLLNWEVSEEGLDQISH